MAQSLATTVRKIEERAEALRKMVDASAHPSVAVVIQRAYASLRGCAELAAMLEPAASGYVDATIADAKRRADSRAKTRAVIAVRATVASFDRLLDSGALLSQARDVEAIKGLGKHTVEAILKLGAKLSGVDSVKTLADLIEAFQDLVKTGQVIKLRKQQIRTASELLKWADAVTLVGLAWGFAAQQFVLGAKGKGNLSDKAVLDLVVARMARCSRTWHV